MTSRADCARLLLQYSKSVLKHRSYNIYNDFVQQRPGKSISLEANLSKSSDTSLLAKSFCLMLKGSKSRDSGFKGCPYILLLLELVSVLCQVASLTRNFESVLLIFLPSASALINGRNLSVG